MTPYEPTPSATVDPLAEPGAKFDEALATVRSCVGAEHPMLIGGSDARAARQFEVKSPIDHRVILGRFQAGDASHAAAAVDAAREAFRPWSAMPWRERVAILRRAVEHLEARACEFGAVLALEAGKTRGEALAEVRQAAELMAHCCDQMEASDGYVRAMARDRLPGFVLSNISVLKPHGAWLVIAPFNLPLACAAGPAAAALVAGNTVVLKPASATPWSGRLFALALRDAGIPPGVFNLVTGPGTSLGEALIGHPDVAGVTFGGSREVGMHLHRRFAAGDWPRPCILEMGGKSAAIVSHHANLEDAVAGIVRSAFGLAGQASSACSRVYVEHTVFADVVSALHGAVVRLAVGDPTRRGTRMGPVIDTAAVARYEDAAAQVRSLGSLGAIVEGGARLDRNDLAHGHFVAPTIARAPFDHPLWSRELFVPFLLVAPVETVDEGIARANATPFGLAAGFYGSAGEAERFFTSIQAGVAYANRPQGATTGARPGCQPFAGWKGSGSTGRGAGSVHYLTQYLREQSQTRVSRESEPADPTPSRAGRGRPDA